MANDERKESRRGTGSRVLGWYYEKGGRRHGPVTHAELRRLVAAAEVGPDTKVYVGWKTGDEIQFDETELRLALGGEPAPAPAARPAPQGGDEPAGPRCPRCRRTDSRRSRVRWFDLPARALRLRPFRCMRCARRFYQFG